MEPLRERIGNRRCPCIGDLTLGKPRGQDLRLFPKTAVGGIPLELVQKILQFEGEGPEICSPLNYFTD
jgi:hypothetical protein